MANMPKRKATGRANGASVITLRAMVEEYREREKIYKLKIYRFESEIKRRKQNRKEIIAHKNIRYDKLRYTVYKLKQKLWVFRKKFKNQIVDPRRKKITHFKRKGVQIGLARGYEKGRIAGYKKGLMEGKKAKNFDLFYRGVAVGKKRERKTAEKAYNYRRKAFYKVESTARMSVILARLSKALQLSPTIVSYLIWVSQREFWTKKDLFRAFDDLGFDGYHFCVQRLKELELIEAMKRDKTTVTWKLTFKGVQLTNKIHKYINKYFKEKP